MRQEKIALPLIWHLVITPGATADDRTLWWSTSSNSYLHNSWDGIFYKTNLLYLEKCPVGGKKTLLGWCSRVPVSWKLWREDRSLGMIITSDQHWSSVPSLLASKQDIQQLWRHFYIRFSALHVSAFLLKVFVCKIITITGRWLKCKTHFKVIFLTIFKSYIQKCRGRDILSFYLHW